ncbi:hypothetical protein BC830DRAFT_123672 [Chytriomyces sp. MP71]|nr:hypothetical protein BC830DRAFT_123672 [Chytriomyces sp. MP71]
MYSLNTFEGHVLLIFSTIIVVTSIFSAIFVFRFRFSALGRAASFQETLSLTFGCTLAGLSLLFLIPDFALNYSCKLQVVVLVSSYALITTPLICKNLKAFQILHRMSRQRGEKLNNTTRMFRLLNIALLTLEAAGLVVWWLKTNLKRVLIHTTALDYYFCRVQASPFAPTFFLFGLNIFFMIALLLAAALSTSIKLSLYNETATLMVTGATLTLVSGLIFAMSKTPEPTTAFNIGVLVFIAAILIIFQNVGIRAMQMFYERVGHSNGRSAVSRVASKMTSLATHGRVGSSRSLKRSHSRVVLSQTSSRRYDMYAAKRVDEEGVVFRDATAWGAVWRTGCMIIHCLGGRKCWVSLEGEQVTLCELLRRDDQVSRDGVCVLIKRFSKLRKGVKFAAVVELASEGEAEHLVDAILKARSELMVPHHEFASMHPPIPFHAQ